RITLKINGGHNGAEDRVARLEWARAALVGA
ncbi:TPA: glycoside hydrolase family 19 protein, partial [Pseudomonas aeruginosa]